jgi:xylulose-5-phosphate/fructose-6-phosphate phosphoketolase
VLGRSSDEDVRALLSGHGYDPRFVAGSDPAAVHQAFAAALDAAMSDITRIQRDARAARKIAARPRWPLLVLRTPKGWTGPKEVDGVPVEGTFRAHQVPLSEVRSNPEHLAMLETWMKSYRPDELFDAQGRLVPERARLAPAGELITWGRKGA